MQKDSINSSISFKDIGFTNCDIIQQNSQQRALQIRLQGQKEVQEQRQRIVSNLVLKIDEQYELKHRLLRAQSKIWKSSLINRNRMAVINKKYELCDLIFRQIEKRLENFAQTPENQINYRQFLVKSTVEGLIRLFEQKVYLRCLPQDCSTMQSLKEECLESYYSYMEEQIGFSAPLEVIVDEKNSLQRRKLPQQLPKGEELNYCLGGIILSDQTGDITFKSTLDCRFNILKEMCLPLIRQVMWGNK